ncbi:MAG: 2TM domain-containing protein [Caulobacterales bacterium]|jgi:hypothetical protein
MSDNPDYELRRQAERRADVKLGFQTHLLAYVVVNAGLVAINLVTSPGYFWAIWPIIGWGLGVLAHGIAVFHFGGDLRERAVETELRRLRERR